MNNVVKNLSLWCACYTSFILCTPRH